MKPGCVTLKCLSWNIAGKYELFKSNILQTFLNKYDIISLTETHTIRKGMLNFPNFKRYEFPDVHCNYEYPRGGICLLVKKDKKDYVKSVKLLMTDFLETTFTNNAKLITLYIPPVDSVYYDEQYIQLLCSEFIDNDSCKSPLIAMGDTNTRLGDLNSCGLLHRYVENPDKVVNENGRHFRDMLFNTTSAVPINHMIRDTSTYDGGFTFCRNNNAKSQIDWCFCNTYQLQHLNGFKIERNEPQISDHKPIVAEIFIDGEKSIDTILKAAKELNNTYSNHSRIPVISKDNTNFQCLENLIKIEIDKCDPRTMNSNELSHFLVNGIQRYGKIAKLPSAQRPEVIDQYGNRNGEVGAGSVIEKIDREDIENWKFIRESNDSKMIWNCINMKGEIKADVENDVNVADLASHCSSRSKIDISQIKYDDISTDVRNEELDKDIDEKEIEEAFASMNEKSKTSDGITKQCLKAIWSTILPLLIFLMNLVFKGGALAYPSNWMSLVNGIPKKGLFEIPKFVRYITIMGIFEKLYQTIINKRLYRFLKIPVNQTAYQSGKGCNLHVMTIRLLKVLTVKTKQKLFIVFTDFEAAFDLVSRRLLFQKLVKLGISSLMLSALIAIYVKSQAVVEHSKEFSDFLILLAGVKQGAPPSGTLYIAYTLGIVDLFEGKFHIEPLISFYHLLMHADDILMLSTMKSVIIRKLECLMKYCGENFVKLQLSKCAMMCVNSTDENDTEPITINNITLKCSLSEVYLGSVITNSNKLLHDVEADIKHRKLNVVKFYAFLRSNRNAPIDVKLRILESCVVQAILHNAETWADCRIDQLEVVYRRMMKSVLGVRMTTCSELLYVELGVHSIKTYVRMKEFEFWKKVQDLSDFDPLKYVISLGKKFNLKEVRHYENLLEKYANTDEIIAEFHEKIRQDIRNKADQNRTRYVTYLKVNPLLEHPSIYKTTYSHKNVSMIAKLRTTTHNLQIDMGRRTCTPPEQRKCHCGVKEDEEHFLLSCNSYANIRHQHHIKHKTIATILDDTNYIPYINSLYEERKLYHG